MMLAVVMVVGVQTMMSYGGSPGPVDTPVPVPSVANPCSRPASGSVVRNPPALFSKGGVLSVNLSYQTRAPGTRVLAGRTKKAGIEDECTIAVDGRTEFRQPESRPRRDLEWRSCNQSWACLGVFVSALSIYFRALPTVGVRPGNRAELPSE
jgi:hypothetical protein